MGSLEVAAVRDIDGRNQQDLPAVTSLGTSLARALLTNTTWATD